MRSKSSFDREKQQSLMEEQLEQLQLASAALMKLAAKAEAGGKMEEEEPEPTVVILPGGKAPIDRDRLCNDILNTGVTAALVGGFALTHLEGGVDVDVGWVGYIIYLASYASVHACTCSALTSALMYREANLLHEDAVTAWAAERKMLLSLPMMKFGMGVLCYLFSVILTAWRDLDSDRPTRLTAMIIGLMSMSTVFMTVLKISYDNFKVNSKAKKDQKPPKAKKSKMNVRTVADPDDNTHTM